MPKRQPKKKEKPWWERVRSWKSKKKIVVGEESKMPKRQPKTPEKTWWGRVSLSWKSRKLSVVKEENKHSGDVNVLNTISVVPSAANTGALKRPTPPPMPRLSQTEPPSVEQLKMGEWVKKGKRWVCKTTPSIRRHSAGAPPTSPTVAKVDPAAKIITERAATQGF